MAAPTWPHWEIQLLSTAGLSTDPGSVDFLRSWNQYDQPKCPRNPLNISQHAPGSADCKNLHVNKWAQAYTSRDEAANAFAEQLNLTDYPDLREALGSGKPLGYSNLAGLLIDLQKWGSVRWRQQVALIEGVNVGTTTPTSVAKAGSNVSGAWTHLHRVLNNDGYKTIVALRGAAASMRTIERRLRRA